MAKQSRCRFCAEPAEFQCGWETTAIKPIAARSVEPGMSAAATLNGSTIFSTVIAVVPLPAASPLQLQIRVVWRGREFVWIRREMESVHIAQTGPCGRDACYRHAREVGPGRSYCMDHWNAWRDDAESRDEQCAEWEAAQDALRRQNAIDTQLLSGGRARGRSAAR